MQETQNTTDVLTKKCSRCKKEQIICNFGFKLNTDPYRTCKRCRKQPIIGSNRPGSSNDHLINIIREIENPIAEDNVVKYPLVEDKLADEPKIEKLGEIFNNDNDPSCILKLSDIFTDYGYIIEPLDLNMIATTFRAMDRPGPISFLINMMITHKSLALSEYEDGVNLIFPPDDKTLYLMTLKNTNLITNFTSKMKYKNKKKMSDMQRETIKTF